MSYEEAIFEIENAWWEGIIDHASYLRTLDYHTRKINQLVNLFTDSSKTNPERDLLRTKEQKQELYAKAIANYAIYSYLTTPTISFDSTSIVCRNRYSYSKQDPLGTDDWTNTQVSHLLNKRSGNCFALASLFKIFSERLQSCANLCTAPGHIYIRHADDKGIKYNIEIGSRSFPGTGTLETLTYTPDEATKSGIALRELDLKQSVALCLVYLAKGYEYKFGIENDPFQLSCAKTALQYDEHNLNAMLLKAEVMEGNLLVQGLPLEKLRKDQAFLDYQQWINHIFQTGYREMPYEMKNLMVKGYTRDTITQLALQDHTPSRLKHPTLKDTRYAGLSWGLFDEEIRTKPFERFGNTVFDTKNKQIVAFLQDDILYNHYNFDPVLFALNVDPMAHKFPHESPYSFAGGNPIYFMDVNGNFKWPGDKAEQKRWEEKYPYFTAYLRDNLPKDVSNSKRIQKALYDNTVGALTPDRVGREVAYGSGPVLIPTLSWGRGHTTYNNMDASKSTIELNPELIQAFEDAMKNGNAYQKQAALTNVISTVFHEYTHYGDMQDGFSAMRDANGNIVNGTGDTYDFGNFGRTGDNFEEGYQTVQDIYGQDVGSFFPGSFLQVKKRREEGKGSFNLEPRYQNSKESQTVTPSEIDPSVLPTVPKSPTR